MYTFSRHTYLQMVNRKLMFLKFKSALEFGAATGIGLKHFLNKLKKEKKLKKKN